MKVINNQWQLSSAICLLIITLLTLLHLTAPKLAAAEPPQAFSTDYFFKQVSSIRFCINSMISVYVLECGYVCTGIIDGLRVQRNTPALLFFHIYIYIAFTGTLQTLKTEFNASGKQNPVGHSHNPNSIITLQKNPLAKTTAGQKSIVLYILLFLQPTQYQ